MNELGQKELMKKRNNKKTRRGAHNVEAWRVVASTSGFIVHLIFNNVYTFIMALVIYVAYSLFFLSTSLNVKHHILSLQV